MNSPHDRRSLELQRRLAARFRIPESTVTSGVSALLESIRGRLPLGVEVCLASWMPDAWNLVSRANPRPATPDPLRADQIRLRVVEAGVPDHHARAFIAAVFEFIEERLGTPLVATIRRKIPELRAFEGTPGARQMPPRS